MTPDDMRADTDVARASVMKARLVDRHQIDPAWAELLSDDDTELLQRQVEHMLARDAAEEMRKSMRVPGEGRNPRLSSSGDDPMRGFVRELFDNPPQG